MRGRLLAVLLREWAELRRNRVVLLSMLLMPLLFAGGPLFALRTEMLDNLANAGAHVGALRRPPELAHLTDEQAVEVFLLGQFLALLLLAPISLPLTIASYSIVGEKQLRTLEPLLASPIRTWELLLGKALAAMLPGLASGWAGYAILVFGAGPTLSPVARAYLIGPTGLLLSFALVPLVALLGVGLAVLGSSRTDDPRAAQQLGVIFILPVIGLLFGQAAGVLYLGPRIILTAVVVTALLNLGLLAISVRLFDRETILTRWK